MNKIKNFFTKSGILILSLTLLPAVPYAKHLHRRYKHKRKNAHYLHKVYRNTLNLQPLSLLENPWTGFYGGLSLSGVFDNVNLTANHTGFVPLNGSYDTFPNFSSFSPGLALGFDYMTPSNLLVGIESDFNYNISTTGDANCPCPPNSFIFDEFRIKNRLQWALRGRIGYLLSSHVLPFVTSGLAIGDFGLKYHHEIGNYYSKNTVQPGWLVGGGFQWGYSHHLSFRAEYFYVHYGTVVNMGIPIIYGLSDPNGAAHVYLNTHNVRFSINYRF